MRRRRLTAPRRAQAWNEFKARPDKQSENDFPGQARPAQPPLTRAAL